MREFNEGRSRAESKDAVMPKASQDDRANKLYPSDEAQEFAGRLRWYREEVLGFSDVPDFAEQAGVARTYAYDCEAGRKFPSRAFVEKIAVLDDVNGPELLVEHEHLAARREMRMRSPAGFLAGQLAGFLHNGLAPPKADPPLPKPKDFPTGIASCNGEEACIKLAVDLLISASHEGSFGNIVINVPSLELTSDQGWVTKLRSAIYQALSRGWSVTHFFRNTSSAARHHELIIHLFSFVGFDGPYRPFLSGHLDAPNFIVADGVGALELYGRPDSELARALLFTWSNDKASPERSACDALLSIGTELEAQGSQLLTIHESGVVLQAANSSTQKGDDEDENANGEASSADRPLPAKVKFDIALTESETTPGPRALIKSGLLVATMPPSVARTQIERWKRKIREIDPKSSDPELIDILGNNRIKRWESLRANGSHLSRDICTREAIRWYLQSDEEMDKNPKVYQLDPLYSGKYLNRLERIAHVDALIDLVNDDSCRYELGLAEDRSALLTPLGDDTYWEAIRSADGAKAQLFFVTFRTREDGSRLVLYGCLSDSTITEAFFELFQMTWDALPPESREPKLVVQWLSERIQEAREAELGNRGTDIAVPTTL